MKQKTLLEDCQYQTQSKANSTYIETQKEHGRIDTRKIEVFNEFHATDETWNTLLKASIRVQRI